MKRNLTVAVLLAVVAFAALAWMPGPSAQPSASPAVTTPCPSPMVIRVSSSNGTAEAVSYEVELPADVCWVIPGQQASPAAVAITVVTVNGVEISVDGTAIVNIDPPRQVQVGANASPTPAP